MSSNMQHLVKAPWQQATTVPLFAVMGSQPARSKRSSAVHDDGEESTIALSICNEENHPERTQQLWPPIHNFKASMRNPSNIGSAAVDSDATVHARRPPAPGSLRYRSHVLELRGVTLHLPPQFAPKAEHFSGQPDTVQQPDKSIFHPADDAAVKEAAHRFAGLHNHGDQD